MFSAWFLSSCSAFHYTGKLNGSTRSSTSATSRPACSAPTVFLHFCLTFPEPRSWFHEAAWRAAVCARRAVVRGLPGVHLGTLTVAMPLVELRWMLDRVWLVLTVLPYLVGRVRLSPEYRKADDPIVRQQLKWLRNGAFCGILPFAVFYVAALRPGHDSQSRTMKMSVLSLAADPAHPGLRHRALPADGRGHHLPPRLRLHAGHALRAGGVLRHRLLAGQPGAEELQGSGQHRADHGHADRGVPVPAHPQLDSGAARPVLLSRPLRLPAHPGGVRPRAQLGDRPGPHAVVGGRAAAADAFDQAPGVLPGGGARGREAAVPAEEGHGAESTAGRCQPTQIWISAFSTGNCPSRTFSSSAPATSSTRSRAPGPLACGRPSPIST